MKPAFWLSRTRSRRNRDHRAQLGAGIDGAPARRAVFLGRGSSDAARIAGRSPGDDPVSQETRELSGEGGASRVARGLDRGRSAEASGRGAARRDRGTPGEGGPSHRHGARAHGVAGHHGRHLRARGGQARGSLEGDLLPLPADRGRSGRAAVTPAAWRGRRHVGGRVARRQARLRRRHVYGRGAPDRIARPTRVASSGTRGSQDTCRPPRVDRDRCETEARSAARARGRAVRRVRRRSSPS